MYRAYLISTLLIVASLALNACSSIIAPQVAAAPAAAKRQAQLQFANHVQMGMTEQDVYVEADDGQVRRMVAADADQFADAPGFGTAIRVEHDPFGLDATLMEPIEKGENLGFTMGEWLAGTGSGTYTVSGDEANLDLTFEKLVPNGIYTVWCSTVSAPPMFRIVDIACGNPYGSNNSVIADDKGNAHVRLATTTMPAAAEGYLPLIALAYHSDGKTYGEYAGDFGLNSHVQLVAFLPAADDAVWQIIE